MRGDGFYRFVVGLARILMGALRWRISVEGEAHIPARGPAILAANHVSFLDFVFIGYGAHRRRRLVRFLSRHEAFSHRVSGPLMRAMRHIPVDRDRDPARAFRHAIAALRRGEVIGLHPEGRMNSAFAADELRTGAARMAIDTGAPLIPVAVTGGERIWSRTHRRLFAPARVRVLVGPPVVHRAGETAQDLTSRLGDAIASLLGVPARPGVARASAQA